MEWLSSVKEFISTNWEKPYEIATSIVALMLLLSGFARPLATLADVLAWARIDAWEPGVRAANDWTVAHAGVELMVAGTPVPVLEVIVTLGVAACVAFAGRSGNLPAREGETFWLLAGLMTYTTLSPIVLAIWAAAALVIKALASLRSQTFVDTIGAAVADVLAGAVWLPILIAAWPFRRKARIKSSAG